MSPASETGPASYRTTLIPGLWTFILTLGIAAGIIAQPGGIAFFSWVNDHFVPLVTASIAMATFQAVFVYTRSFFSGELLALQGNTGSFIYDVSNFSVVAALWERR